MKQFIKAFFLFAFFLLSNLVFSQNENSLLWKISGNGLKQPSYIFGTIHMICPEDYFLDEKVTTALNESKAFYTEINFGNLKEIMQMQDMIFTNKPLSERLSKKDYDRLKKVLKEKANQDIEALNQMSDLALLSMITTQSFPCKDIKIYEMELLQQAKTSKKRLAGLETVSEQMALMQDSFSLEAIITILEEEDTTEQTDKLIALYKAQNIDALVALMNDANYMDKETQERLLKNRNNNWVAKMPKLMEQESIFFAVGAGHLGEKFGVLELLRKKGYQVEAVK